MIRCLKVDYTDCGDDGKQHLLLLQLGVMVNKTTLSPSPLLKYRGIARVDPQTGAGYHIGIVVRQNGRWEVYSDFMLVYDYYD